MEVIDGTEIEEDTKYFINRGLWGKVSDLLRLWILSKYGGVYMDVDQFITAYDKRIHYFEFIGYTSKVAGDALLETSLMGSKPGHPIPTKAVEIMTMYQRSKQQNNIEGFT